ncbi:hypothetical protein EBQ74_10355 [bacterium]|nr:hypothetical protein [bacterium]
MDDQFFKGDKTSRASSKEENVLNFLGRMRQENLCFDEISKLMCWEALNLNFLLFKIEGLW